MDEETPIPEKSWDLRWRPPEEYHARRSYEIRNFGTTSIGPPPAAFTPQPPTAPAAPLPLPGVYTLPLIPSPPSAYAATQPLPAQRKKRRKTGVSDISLPELPTETLPGYTRRDVDTTFEFSADGDRAVRVAELRNVPIVKRVRVSSSSDWVGRSGMDPPAGPENGDSDSDESVAQEEMDTEDPWQDVEEGCNPAALLDETGEIRDGKRKTYASSDDPMSLFLPMMDTILDETFVRESIPTQACCHTCCAPLATPPSPSHASASSPPGDPLPPSLSSTSSTPEDGGRVHVDQLFKCTTCGEFLECRSCCMERHQHTPLHMIKVWSAIGHFSRTALRDLGLCFQLGHGGGRCPVPGALRAVTVMHVNGVHQVTTSICGCDLSDDANEWRQYIRMGWYPASTAQPRTFATFECLRHFRRLNVVANVNVRDYVTTLERLSDPMGLEFLPDRYKSFGLMSQQVSYLDRMRRSGLGYLKGGVRSAAWGSAAVRCWACPRAKVNLPENWKEVEGNLQFKYALILGMDACFRLENRLRAKSENKAYTILADGLGCFVPHESYFSHLKNYVKEDDISSCIAFAALMQKDTRISRGLRATGVGGCICTRHEVIRPLGLGDLLKGERYANMDYIFWASILGEDLLQYVVSYDIGCQWKINMEDRRKNLPAILRDDSDTRNICVGLPVWHGGGHRDACNSSESLRYKQGAGMTDGEGVERVWSKMGPKAWATKEMHENTRHESLEDTMDDLNWTKNLGLGILLRRRYEVAKVEQKEQAENFKTTSATLDIKLRESWMAWIKDWHAQEFISPKDKTVANPYEASWKNETITVDRVHTDLDREELEQLREERQETNKKKSTSGNISQSMKGVAGALAFVRLGLDVQSLQLRIKNMNKARRKEDGHARLLQARRTGFWKKLRRFCALQATFMPHALALASDHEQAITAKREEAGRKAKQAAKPVEAEDVRLFLPSEIPKAERGPSYRQAIFSTESRLREAQCSTQLSTLRMLLHTKSHLIRFRDANLRGQTKTTRSRGALDRLSDRIDSAVRRYRVARKALVGLDGEEKWSHFRVLDDADVSTRFVTDYDGLRARRLAKIGRDGKRSMIAHAEEENDGAEVRGGSRRKLSWIWTAQGVPDPDEDEALHESIRLEWTKAYARKERWREELLLLEEEMRRVVASLEYERGEWTRRKDEVVGRDRISAGKRAYAQRQAALRSKLRDECKTRFESVEELGRTGKKRRANTVAQG